MINNQYIVKHFRDLSPAELYAIMRLRNEVFVVEQQCTYQDADNKDPYSHHVMSFKNGELAAYCRIVPAGLSFRELSIGRVVTSPRARGTGEGKKLMIIAIENCRKLFGRVPIRIGAQLYAKEFYSKLGFKESGAIYDEDGIPHVEMILLIDGTATFPASL
jgi:ElaA protein